MDSSDLQNESCDRMTFDDGIPVAIRVNSIKARPAYTTIDRFSAGYFELHERLQVSPDELNHLVLCYDVAVGEPGHNMEQDRQWSSDHKSMTKTIDTFQEVHKVDILDLFYEQE
ncbi:hypothetical protein ABG067_000678 [Albugo candida]